MSFIWTKFCIICRMNENAGNDQTLSQELRGMMSQSIKRFLDWLKPSPDEPWYIDMLRFIYKIPVVVLAVFASPIVLVILLFTFLAAF